MTTNNPKPVNFINDDIDNEIRKIVKETNNIEQDLENIKNLLQEPQYKGSYPNIRPFFESQKGFNALKDVLLFEKNRKLGKTTQENINVSSAMEILKNIFVDNNSEALELQKNIAVVDQSIKLKKGQSEKSEAQFKEKLKKESKANPVARLLRLLFKKITNKIFEEIKKEQLGKSKEELNSLKDQLHKITDSFNKELNSLMDAYGKGIESSTTEVLPYAVSDVTSDRFNQRKNESTYLSMNKNIKPHQVLLQEARMEQKQESEYVAFDPGQINAQQQNGKKAKKSVTFNDKVKVHKYEEQKTIDNDSIYDVPKPQSFQMYDAPKPQHFQIHDLPKPQRAQISETQPKPQIAPKPNLKNRFDAKGDGLQSAGNVKDMAKKLEAKGQEKKAPIQSIIKQMRVREEIKSSGLGSTQGLAKRLGANMPNRLNIPEGFKRELEKITTIPSPSSSPTSSKKSFFAIFKSDYVQNKAPKVQEIKQSVFYNSIPTPPPMPTEEDLKKVKPTSGKELNVASQVNPKKRTVIEGKTTEGKNVNWNQALNENPIFKKRKASIEEDKPQTKLTTPKMEHEKSTPTIGG